MLLKLIVSRDQRGRRQPYTVDLVALTPRDDQLAVLLEGRGEQHDRWMLPWEAPRTEESLDDVAERLTRRTTGDAPAWTTQVGAFTDGDHPAQLHLSVAYVTLVPLGAPDPADPAMAWCLTGSLPALGDRQHAMIRAALGLVRDRIDLYPVAFRLLPPAFTLSELQQMYELLLGRRLHKASFRRALQAAFLVEPTDEWRSEGRGRPAQLYRYAPKRRRRGRRGVRFDLLS